MWHTKNNLLLSEENVYMFMYFTYQNLFSQNILRQHNLCRNLLRQNLLNQNLLKYWTKEKSSENNFLYLLQLQIIRKLKTANLVVDA